MPLPNRRTAARMESVNKHLGTRICVAGATLSQCPQHFSRPVGSLILKGKTEAIEAFEPITEERSHTEFIKKYVEAFEHLVNEDPQSEKLFADLKSEYPDDPLVNLHYNRILSGVVSATIVMSEK